MPRFVTFTCENCGKEKTVRDWYFLQIYPPGTDKPLACSRKCGCQLRERGRQIQVTCPNCGKVNTRKKSHAERVFCNQACFSQYRNAHPELFPSRTMGQEEISRLRLRIGSANPAYGSLGNKCVHWKGGMNTYRGKGWRTIRKLIIRRDEQRCALCGATQATAGRFAVHHIFEWADTHCNHPHNLITVCRGCHDERLHGPEPEIPRRQLVNLAREATLARLAPDDLRLIEELDLRQRAGRPLPSWLAETLALPE